MLQEPLFWFSVFAVFLIIESGVPGHLYSLLFSIGALVTGFVSIFIDNPYLLVIIYLVVSLVVTFTAKRPLEKFFKSRGMGRLSNVDLIIGKTAYVAKAITPIEKGYVIINNEEWLAASEDNDEIGEGTKVVVNRIVGTTLIVSVFNEEVLEEEKSE